MNGIGVSAVTAYTAHREWASRPPDERYASVQALYDAARARRFRTDTLGPRPDITMQSVPIVVNNVMYSQAGTRRTGVALDPVSGEMLWMYRMDECKRGAAAPRQGSGSGHEQRGASMHAVAVEDDLAAKLAENFRGEMLRPGDPNYDSARSIFNGMFDTRPALVARCSGVSDVIAALQTARDTGVDVAVRGGGHGVPGYASVEDGLVIVRDLLQKGM